MRAGLPPIEITDHTASINRLIMRQREGDLYICSGARKLDHWVSCELGGEHIVPLPKDKAAMTRRQAGEITRE